MGQYVLMHQEYFALFNNCTEYDIMLEEVQDKDVG